YSIFGLFRGMRNPHQNLNDFLDIKIHNPSAPFPSDDSLVQEGLRSQQLRVYTADLSDFTDLQASLDQIKKHEDHIDLLFNNAGVSFGELSYSKQGREMHFEVNSVVPYVILMEMKALLEKGSLKTV
ncbi:SDR family NAD(P)-dependent oxidoreductase, partial [Clostridium perfringens]|uniref:SDR family NAD(P)-dependent oxidoreductase n=1 Tax=Clostridium perfringens TaxID=1502 RepID=UPI002AC6CF73